MVCKPIQPLCKMCILKDGCYAFHENMIKHLPLKNKKLKVRTRYFYYNIVLINNGVLIKKREAKDIWRDLHEFPLIEQSAKNIAINKTKKLIEKKTELKLLYMEKSKWYEQKLTHQKVLSCFYIWQVEEPLLDANKKYNFLAVY